MLSIVLPSTPALRPDEKTIFVPSDDRTGYLSSQSSLVRFIWPVPAAKRISSYYGMRRGRHHDGIDIPARSGSHILAADRGKVIFSGRMRGYGRVVVIKHDGGYHTVYAHNKQNYVNKGQKVGQGEVIAQVGSSGRSSGPHLHFEIRKNNRVRDPANYLHRVQKMRLAHKH